MTVANTQKLVPQAPSLEQIPSQGELLLSASRLTGNDCQLPVMAAHAPLGRLGDDEDLKGITLLYASAAGKHITGQWLAVDGGVSAVLG